MKPTQPLQLFESPDWRSIVLPGVADAYVCAEMLIVIIDASQQSELIDRWPTVQTEIKHWRNDRNDDRELEGIDIYLLIVVAELKDVYRETLRAAVDDRFVCRKIIIPLRGRALMEAIIDEFLPFHPVMPSVQPMHLHDLPNHLARYLPRLEKDAPEDVADFLIQKFGGGGGIE